MNPTPSALVVVQRLFALCVVVVAAALGVSTSPASAQGKPHNLPLVGKNRGTPMLMINMSKDHQLSYRAYVEYQDLDGDGQLETSYKHSVEYYGYFDAYKCYRYASGVFTPTGYTSDRYCAAGSGTWSGNFLNWSTMTRMDVVRRILYGGYRSTDGGSSTVLERAYLPTDAHSFAKYYAGTDIARLTPFSVSEISICNTTLGGGGANELSHTNTNPPLMRVAAGNYQLWNNNERWQCYWSEEKGASWTSNASDKALTGLNAEISNPSRNSVGLRTGSDGPDYVVRVQACVGATDPDPSIATTERCLKYPSGNRKPTGLLHEFGQDNRMLFGLMTGSFQRNTSGGVLRSNVRSFRDEINVDTDGSFKSDEKGIVWNIDRLRMYGYNYGDGSYIPNDNCPYQLIGLSDGRCRSWGNPMSEIYTESLRYFAGKRPTSAFETSGGADGALGLTTTSWKDPFKPATSADRLPGVNACSPLHVLNFNASVSSWDFSTQVDITDMGAPRTANAYTREVGSGEGLTGKSLPIGSSSGSTNGLCTPKTITDLGELHGLCPESPTQQGGFSMAGAAYWARTQRIRSDLTGVPADTDLFKPLRVNTLGVAMATNTPVIRIPVPGSASKVVTIQPTYLLQLGSARGNGTLVEFRVVYQDLAAGQGRFFVSWEDSEQGGDYDQDVSGYIKYWFSADRTKLHVETHVTGYSSGNPQGFGYILTGTTQDGPRFHSGAAGFTFTQPEPVNIYRPTGTTSGGRVSTLAATPINGASDSKINTSGGCVDCRSSGGWDGGGGLATVAIYDVTGSTGEVLQDPMWYAAKWGGFKDLDNNGRPSSLGEWAARNRARPPYDAMSDAQAALSVSPDNFFFAANPGLLPAALREALTAVDTDSSRSGLSISSRTIFAEGTGTRTTRAYTTSFKGDWTGDVTAYTFDAAGLPVSRRTASSELGRVDPDARVIQTRTERGEMPFRWASVSGQTAALLNLSPATATDDGNGERRLLYLRGVTSNELRNGGAFRNRAGRLADIVNSSPLYVGAPRALQRINASDDGYAAFRTANANRRPMLYVGSNGGMLHGFDADTLQERIAYVPRALHGKLPALTDSGYVHEYFVDGSPFAADVKLSGNWRTILFGTLGAGGQGIYALDVTDPSSFREGQRTGFSRWEFSDADDPDLGYVIGETSERLDFQPNNVVLLGAQREPYLVIGNGVASGSSDQSVGSGRSALFLLRVAGPADGQTWQLGRDYFKIVVGSSTQGGLGMPYLVDIEGDGRADYAYAGDVQGNLWKFDLRADSPSGWTAAFSGQPLYIARNASNGVQRITSTPVAVTLEPRVGGVFIVFGTGSYYQQSDATDTSRQSIYGVWDNGSTVRGRGGLVAQTISSISGAGVTGGFRDLSNNRVCLSASQTGCGSTGAARGWYIDLATDGERVVYNPGIDRAADLVVTTTVPGDIEACDSDGTTWYYRMALLSGSRIDVPMFDTNQDGRIDASDRKTSAMQKAGVRKPMRLMQPRSTCSGPGCEPGPCFGAQGTSSGTAARDLTRCARVDPNRLNWREIIR